MKRDPFAAIADPTRRAIIHILSASPLTVNQVADHFMDISRQAVSKQIRHLQRSGFVKMMDIGRERHCHLQPIAFRALNEWVQQYSHLWDDGTAAAVAQQEQQEQQEPAAKPKKTNPKKSGTTKKAPAAKPAPKKDDGLTQLSMFDL